MKSVTTPSPVHSISLPRRFQDTTAPDIWDELFNELWAHVFSFGPGFGEARRASKWFNNLYWDYCATFSGLDTSNPSNTTLLVHKTNPACLRELDISMSKFTDLHVSLCMYTPRGALRTLILDETCIADNTLLFMGYSCINLTSLSIQKCCSLTDKGIEAITKLTRLETLHMKKCRLLTDNILLYIGKLTRLRTLTMSPSPLALMEIDQGRGVSVNPDTLAKLRELVGDCRMSHLAGLSQLTILDVGSYMVLTARSIETLVSLKQLRTLYVQQCQLLDEKAVERLASMKQLVHLMAGSIHYVDDLSPFAQLTMICHLSLPVSTLSDTALVTIAHNTKHSLVLLDIMKCHRITTDGLARFQEIMGGHFPFDIVYIEGCRGFANVETLKHVIYITAVRDSTRKLLQWKSRLAE